MKKTHHVLNSHLFLLITRLLQLCPKDLNWRRNVCFFTLYSFFSLSFCFLSFVFLKKEMERAECLEWNSNCLFFCLLMLFLIEVWCQFSLDCMFEFLGVVRVWDWDLPISRFPYVRGQVPFYFFLITSQSLFLNVYCSRPRLPPWAWNVQPDSRLAVFHGIQLTCLLFVPHGDSSDFPQLPVLLISLSLHPFSFPFVQYNKEKISKPT